MTWGGEREADRILKHLAEIGTGHCSLDDETILSEKNPDMTQILLGLLILHEDLSYTRQLNEDAEEQRAKAAAERENLLSELQTAVTARDQFLAVASHELRTPITTLMLLADNLAQAIPRGPVPPELKPFADRLPLLQRQVTRLSTLVTEMLDVSRITAGRLELNPTPLDLIPLVQEVVGRFSLEPGRVKAPLELVHPATLLGEWDGSRIDQVLTNLISNAIKYGRGKPITVRVDDRDARVLLEVHDHGVGISKDDQAKLFAPFARAHSAEHYGGLGLGLWICRQIVEASGGKITVESVPNEGSTFAVELPKIFTKPQVPS